jgi:hypothetical protein
MKLKVERLLKSRVELASPDSLNLDTIYDSGGVDRSRKCASHVSRPPHAISFSLISELIIVRKRLF